MTYEESATLMNDAAFHNRVKVSCLKFADYIVGEAVTVPAHNTRYKWAQQTMINSDAAAAQITPSVVMDNQVQTDGAAITDVALQTSVETTVNKML